MKKKLLIVDGHGLLFRMFFGIPARIFGRNNEPIHAVVGFIGSLLKILTELEPSHFLIVFDPESGLSKKEIYPEYKGNRVKDWSIYTPDKNPFTQLPYILKAIDYLNWKYCELPDVEADDVIASYVKKYQNDSEIIIVSNDSDFLQLVNNSVSMYYPRGKKSIMYTPKEVKKKFGIGPQLIPDYKSLVGDNTDNINGIKGIGKKTAEKLLIEFGTINSILENLTNIKSESLRMKISKNKNLLYRNLSLINLDKVVALPVPLSGLKFDKNSLHLKTMQIMEGIKII